jgi:hypothetical protein
MGGDVLNLGISNMDGYYGMIGALVGVVLGNVIVGLWISRRL